MAEFGHRIGLPINIRISARGVAATTGKVSGSLRKIQSRALMLRRGLSDLSFGFESLRRAVQPFLIGGTIAGFFAVRGLLRFNDQMTRSEAALGGFTSKMRGQAALLVKMAALNRANNASVEEAAKAYDLLAHSGIRELADQRAYIDTSLQLASLDTKLSSEQAAQSLIDLQRGFGLPSSSVTRLGDLVARTADSVQGNVSDITMSMRTLGPAAASMGMKIEDALALSAVLKRAGLDSSRVGTGGARFLMALIDPRKAEAFSKILGHDVNDAFVETGGNVKNLNEIVEELHGAFKGMGKAAAASQLRELFDLRGMRAAVKLLVTQGDEIANVRAKIVDGATAEEKALIISSSLSSTLKNIMTTLELIAIDFVGTFDLSWLGTVRDNLREVYKAFELITQGWSDSALEFVSFKDSNVETARGIRNGIEGAKKALSSLGAALVSILPGADGTNAGIAETVTEITLLAPVIGAATFAMSSFTNALIGVSLIGFGTYRVIAALGPSLISVISAASSWPTLIKFATSFKYVNAAAAILGMRLKGVAVAIAVNGAAVATAVAEYGIFKGAMLGLATVGAGLARMLGRTLVAGLKMLVSPMGIVLGLALALSGAFSSAATAADNLAKQRTKPVSYLDQALEEGSISLATRDSYKQEYLKRAFAGFSSEERLARTSAERLSELRVDPLKDPIVDIYKRIREIAPALTRGGAYMLAEDVKNKGAGMFVELQKMLALTQKEFVGVSAGKKEFMDYGTDVPVLVETGVSAKERTARFGALSAERTRRAAGYIDSINALGSQVETEKLDAMDKAADVTLEVDKEVLGRAVDSHGKGRRSRTAAGNAKAPWMPGAVEEQR